MTLQKPLHSYILAHTALHNAMLYPYPEDQWSIFMVNNGGGHI